MSYISTILMPSTRSSPERPKPGTSINGRPGCLQVSAKKTNQMSRANPIITSGESATIDSLHNCPRPPPEKARADGKLFLQSQHQASRTHHTGVSGEVLGPTGELSRFGRSYTAFFRCQSFDMRHHHIVLFRYVFGLLEPQGLQSTLFRGHLRLPRIWVLVHAHRMAGPVDGSTAQ